MNEVCSEDEIQLSVEYRNEGEGNRNVGGYGAASRRRGLDTTWGVECNLGPLYMHIYDI